MNYSNLPIFFSPDIETSKALCEVEAHHAIKVLRLQMGDKIIVTDGNNHFYHCVITKTDKKNCLVDIIKKELWYKPWKGNITLAIAPTKNIDRMEWMVEKLVEIGVDRIIFIKSDHSERKNIRIERIEKIAISAMKQSIKAVLPIIEIGTNIKDVFKSFKSFDNKLIAHCYDNIDRTNITKVIQNDNNNTIVMIGPEGDFSENEIYESEKYGFISISLGNCRLRTETAGIFAVSCIHFSQNT